MKTWWQQLNGREQKLVATMAGVIFIFLFYLLVWQPLNQSMSKTQQKLQRQQQLLSWVQESTRQYQQAKRGNTSTRGNASLSSIVSRMAKQNQLTITRLQPQGDDLQIWIDQVAFVKLLAWLELIANQEGLYVKAIDLSNTEQAGVVQVKRLQLGKS